jgi:hypothetical protein
MAKRRHAGQREELIPRGLGIFPAEWRMMRSAFLAKDSKCSVMNDAIRSLKDVQRFLNYAEYSLNYENKGLLLI